MKLRPRDIVTASVAGILFGFLIYKGFPKVVKFPLALAGLSALLAIFAAAHILTLRTLQKTKKRIKEIQRTLANLPHAHALIKKNQEQLDILTYSLLDHWDLFEKSCQTESSGSAAELLKRTLQDIQKHRAPRLIPPRLLSDYTMGGQIKVQQKYRDSVYPPEKPVFYERAKIEAHIEQIRRGERNYPRYGVTNEWLFQALEKHGIRGKTVAVMGSNKPWFESVCLSYGGRCTTIEYNRILTDHPGLTILTPDEYDKNPVKFEAAFSISSFEHDGLGRYGDPLNPNGDLDTMKKMKRMLLPGGVLYLAVPVGQDRLIWNAHRVYGKLRLPLLLKGWKVIESFGFDESALEKDKNGYEPLFVLRNTI